MNRIVLIVTLLFSAGLLNLTFGGVANLPGYVITQNNDTLEGTISINNWDQLTFEGQFFEAGSVDGIVITPYIIKEFGVDVKIFKSAIILIEQRPLKKSQLPTTPVINYRNDTTFLQVVVSGEKELLYLDNFGKDSYYIKDGDNYNWLIYGEYISTNGGRKTKVTNNNYIGQLIMYLDGCSSMNKILSGTTYDQKSLVKAFKHYYKCTQSDMKQVKEEDASWLCIYALAGVTATRNRFSGTGNEYLTDVSIPWSISFSGGIGVEVLLPNTNDRWSVINELVFYNFNTKTTYTSVIDENNYTITKTNLGQNALKLNTMFRAEFLVNYSNIFIDVGLYNSFALSDKNIKKTLTVSPLSETSTETFAIDNMRNHGIGLIVGLGMKFNKITGVIRYEIGTGISGNSELESSMSRFSLSIGYRFL